MLILSRKSGQKLIINDDIIVTVLDVGNGNVKIGIEAPPEAKIYREEIYQAVKLANMESKLSTISSFDALNNLNISSDGLVENK